MEKQEIRQKYDQAASWYDWADALPEVLGVWWLRRKLLRRVGRTTGQVLEVACGTGKNFRFYPSATDLVAVDLSQKMLETARQRARTLGLEVVFATMDGEQLAIRDRSVDTVLSSLTLCTFPNPINALQEMSRVCRPEGQILLLEHGRSRQEWLGRWQDRRAGRHAQALGCNWNREPLELGRQAGLQLIWAQRTFFGIIHLIETKPAWQEQLSRSQ
jgi:ubiquinone/menaquinone biosynthesis C-methylase UbiE